MNEKKRSFVRLAPNTSRSSSFQISPSSLQQKRIGMIPTFGNALPSLAPVNDNHSFQQLKSLYTDVSTSISQFINHSSANVPFRASLALLIKDLDSLFQAFHSTASKIFGANSISQHSHSSLSKTISSSAVQTNNSPYNTQTFSSQRNFFSIASNSNTNTNNNNNNNTDSNLSELNLKTIKSATEPFLIGYVKMSNQMFNVKESGFASIVEGITNLFNIVFTVIEKLGNLPSNTANVRENPKKISMTLRSNANQIQGSIRKLIQISSNNISSTSDVSNSITDLEQKVKQIVSMVHDFSQMFSNSLANDFTASIATQECNIIRNEVLAALNDIIQDVRSVALFETDIYCIASSMSKFEPILKSFVYSIGLSFPSEEEIKNNQFSIDNDNEANTNSCENNGDNQNNSECGAKNIPISDTKPSRSTNDETQPLDFNETMNVYELIQVAEKLFPKSLAVYSQDLSSSMLRFLSLLRGKLVEYETNFKKVNVHNNEVEIQRIQKINDMKVNQLEKTIKSLNQSLLRKNKDIDFFQNSPSMQYLQDVVSLLYAEDGQTSSTSVKISEFDLIDPLFMKRLTDRVNELKGRRAESQSKNSEESGKCEDAKKKLIQILNSSNQNNSNNDEDDILTLVEKLQVKIDDLKQGIQKNNEEMENVRKFAESLKEGLNELTSIFPSLSNELKSMINGEDNSNLDQNALKIIELLKKSIEDEKEKKIDKKNDIEMFEKFKSLLCLVIDKVSKFLNISPPDKPIVESVEYLLMQLEHAEKK